MGHYRRTGSLLSPMIHRERWAVTVRSAGAYHTVSPPHQEPCPAE